MTKKEITGTRDLTFSGWIRDKLPSSSTGFMVTDIDFCLFNYKTKKFMIIEIKTRGAIISDWQRNFYRMLNRWIKKGIDKDWQYKGIHLIQFENTNFKDGKCFFDKKEITESELIRILSLN